MTRKRPRQNHVFGEKAAHERHTRETHYPNQESGAGHRHFPCCTGQLGHIPGFGCVDDRTCCQKEKRLEYGVRHQVELGPQYGSGPDGEKHVPQLAHGGKRQHLLYVVCVESHERRNQDGESARPHCGRRPSGHPLERRVESHYQIDAGIHDGSGVQESRCRTRRLHGSRQPNMKRYLSRPYHGSQEDCVRSHCRERWRRDRRGGPDGPDYLREAKRPGAAPIVQEP